MKTWQKAAIVGGGVLAFSLLPIWRSGENRGQNVWQFLYHHSVFNSADAMWVKKEDLEKIREMSSNGDSDENGE